MNCHRSPQVHRSIRRLTMRPGYLQVGTLVVLCSLACVGTNSSPLCGQEVSSRRSAAPSIPRLPIPAGRMVSDNQRIVSEPARLAVPSRLPPVQGEGVAEDLASQGNDVQAYEIPPRDEYGRAEYVAARGWKYRLQSCYWGFPEYFCERPFGAAQQVALDAMIGNGLGDYLILYQYDFHDGSAAPASELNHAGLVRLERIVRLLRGQAKRTTVVVEFIPGEQRLGQARVEYVAERLAEMGVDDKTTTVALGIPRRGLAGEEALINHQNMLRSASRYSGGTGGSSSGTGQTGGTAVQGQ